MSASCPGPSPCTANARNAKPTRRHVRWASLRALWNIAYMLLIVVLAGVRAMLGVIAAVAAYGWLAIDPATCCIIGAFVVLALAQVRGLFQCRLSLYRSTSS